MDNAWQSLQLAIPLLQCDFSRKLHGRSIHHYDALQMAQKEREMLSEALERVRARVQREALELREKHGFSDKTIAAAAAFFDQTRDLADKLREQMLKELDMQSACPYCAGPLGETPNLDHIHPTSHGGLSKRDNLVFACSTCNLKKSDLTLREFAERTGFDFVSIVARLRAIGKRV